jgi:uncharacterized protein (TIGR03437 family)
MILLCAFTISISAQTVDSTGNGMLKGPYFVRQVLTLPDQNTSAITNATSILGTITFDGAGKYSFTGQKMESTGGTASAYSTNGTYSVASNGTLQIQSPIDNTDTEFGGLGAAGPSAIVASATEGDYDDIFIAIPAGSAFSNSSIQGSYRFGFLDFLGANASQVRDGFFTATSNGSGSFGNVSVNGSMANQGNNQVTQSLSGVTYSIANANGSGTITFPTASAVSTALVSGQKTLYVSQDGNLMLGGSPAGFDIFVGVKAGSGLTNGSFQGTYLFAGLENSDASGGSGTPNFIDSFYGSRNSNGQGTAITHLRLVGFDFVAYDYTTDETFNFASDGTFNDGTLQNLLGANGQAGIAVGTGPDYSLTLQLQAKQVSGTGVFLNPLGIVNSASFAPITNSVAPGEVVTLFGSGLASATLQAGALPLPQTLGGVQVMVNRTPAPLFFVSSTQISIVVPFDIPAFDLATFIVTNNGIASNPVTLYTAPTAPGVFSTTQNGVGPAAVTHANGTLVSASNPATVGETLVLYLTGLGSVTPSVSDGAAGPLKPLSNVDASVTVELQDVKGNYYTSPNVSFAGLAPGFAGLYQVNFVVPSRVPSGQAYVNVGTDDAYTTETKIAIK